MPLNTAVTTVQDFRIPSKLEQMRRKVKDNKEEERRARGNETNV